MSNIKKLADYILSLSNLPIYLCGHISPDQDSVCSCFAMQQFLSKIGKTANVLLQKNDLNLLDWTQENEKICQDIKQNDYIFIALDLNDIDRLGDFKKYYLNAKIKINIDHHSGNSTGADFVYSDEKSSSTCEIVYNLINLVDKKLLDLTVCNYLYAGIMTDTNCFARRLTNKTLTIVQKFINKGVNYQTINSKTLWKRTQSEVVCAGQLASQIKRAKNFDYVVCDTSISPFCYLSFNDLTKKVAEDIRKIDFLDTFVFLVKYQDIIRAKVMSKTIGIACDIAKIFGGGGHKKEAGFATHFSEKQIVEKIENFLDNNC